MKLYGHPESACTRKVLLTLAEKGHAVELVRVDLDVGEHRRPAHLARHPFGRIPVLDDAGFWLYESSAIMRYLEETLRGPRLLPANAGERARVEQWMSAAASYLAPPLGTLQAQHSLGARFGATPDSAEVLRAVREVAEVLDILERDLAAHEPGAFVAGAEFSLADIALLPHFQTLVDMGQRDLIAARCHIQSWWTRARSRPTSHKVLGTRVARGLRRLEQRGAALLAGAH